METENTFFDYLASDQKHLERFLCLIIDGEDGLLNFLSQYSSILNNSRNPENLRAEGLVRKLLSTERGKINYE